MQLQRALRGIRSLDHLANAFGRPDCFQLRILEAGDVQTATPEGTNRASAELYMPTEAGRRQQCSRLIQPAVQVTRHAAPSGAPGKLPAARLWIDCHAFQCVAGRRRRGRYGVPGRGCAFDSAACAIGSWQRRRLRHRCACCKQGLSASVSVEGGRVAVVVPVEGSRRAHGAGCRAARAHRRRAAHSPALCSRPPPGPPAAASDAAIARGVCWMHRGGGNLDSSPWPRGRRRRPPGPRGAFSGPLGFSARARPCASGRRRHC
mmetsp:Transcript_17834/g.53458  ORF Transcript_17834/g.53458 Transcript_17834/m.53458 type:complete len:262 (-) Transcript_17834:82-867(-)